MTGVTSANSSHHRRLISNAFISIVWRDFGPVLKRPGPQCACSSIQSAYGMRSTTGLMHCFNHTFPRPTCLCRLMAQWSFTAPSTQLRWLTSPVKPDLFPTSMAQQSLRAMQRNWHVTWSITLKKSVPTIDGWPSNTSIPVSPRHWRRQDLR